MVAVAHQRSAVTSELLDLAVAEGRPLLALVGIQDPGNAGTLLRVAEAAGCAGALLTSGSVDIWNPKAVRASAGSLLRLPVAAGLDADDLVGALRSHEDRAIELVATVREGGMAPEATDLTGARVILVGSESQGLPTGLVAAAALRVTVPMDGSVESLNAAVSGAILAFEAARQRRLRAEQDHS